MRTATMTLILAASLAVAGCGDTTGERAATGAVGGAIVGTAVGGPLLGAAAGGTIGAVTTDD